MKNDVVPPRYLKRSLSAFPAYCCGDKRQLLLKTQKSKDFVHNVQVPVGVDGSRHPPHLERRVRA
jgi:hypothetical protein